MSSWLQFLLTLANLILLKVNTAGRPTHLAGLKPDLSSENRIKRC